MGWSVALVFPRTARQARRFISAAILLSAIATLLAAILPPMNIAGADTVRDPGRSVGQGRDGSGAPATAEPAIPCNVAADDDPSPDHTAEDQLEAWVVGATDTGAQPALVLSADEEAAAIAAGWAPPR